MLISPPQGFKIVSGLLITLIKAKWSTARILGLQRQIRFRSHKKVCQRLCLLPFRLSRFACHARRQSRTANPQYRSSHSSLRLAATLPSRPSSPRRCFQPRPSRELSSYYAPFRLDRLRNVLQDLVHCVLVKNSQAPISRSEEHTPELQSHSFISY